MLSFLFNRTIQVQVGNEVSQIVSIENGTPQLWASPKNHCKNEEQFVCLFSETKSN